MSSCNDINALMMDWLYDELEPDRRAEFDQHLTGCANCHAEVDALNSTRAALRALPDEEPPPSLSAILLHEAARHAPRADANDRQAGPWSRLLALFQPMLAHPAATAIATLVLVAGVAGTLFFRGVDKAEEPHNAQGERVHAEKKAASSAPAAVDRRPPTPSDTPAGDGFRRARILDESRANSEPGISVDTVERSLKQLPEQNSRPDSQIAPPARKSRSRSATGSLKAGAKKRPRSAPAKNRRDAPAAADDFLLEADAPVETEEDSDGEEYGAEAEAPSSASEALEKPRAERQWSESLSKPGLTPRPESTRPRTAETRRKPRQVSQERRTDRTLAPGEVASGVAPAPAETTAQPDHDGAVVYHPRAKRSVSKSADKSRSQRAERWGRAQSRKLSRAVRAKRCTEAAQIANDILDRDPSYYRRYVQSSKDLARCRSDVLKEQRLRAARRARKSYKGKADVAAEPAADDVKSK
ncbi:MAG: zf-HC2 domain-containing protein [Proteobacteria bacterium]|nr:zf-HC2 domain-containing protein [Pseudomonadota bacterium]